MSYSRWGGSYWYTFWACADYNVVEDRDNAVFEICTIARFTAKEIRENVVACVDRAFRKITHHGDMPGPADLLELQELMLEFLGDVDRKYPKPDTAATGGEGE